MNPAYHPPQPQPPYGGPPVGNYGQPPGGQGVPNQGYGPPPQRSFGGPPSGSPAMPGQTVPGQQMMQHPMGTPGGTPGGTPNQMAFHSTPSSQVPPLGAQHPQYIANGPSSLPPMSQGKFLDAF